MCLIVLLFLSPGTVLSADKCVRVKQQNCTVLSASHLKPAHPFCCRLYWKWATEDIACPFCDYSTISTFKLLLYIKSAWGNLISLSHSTWCLSITGYWAAAGIAERLHVSVVRWRHQRAITQTNYEINNLVAQVCVCKVLFYGSWLRTSVLMALWGLLLGFFSVC